MARSGGRRSVSVNVIPIYYYRCRTYAQPHAFVFNAFLIKYFILSCYVSFVYSTSYVCWRKTTEQEIRGRIAMGEDSV